MASPQDSQDPQTEPKFRLLLALRRFTTRDSRDRLWAALDMIDARPALKRALVFGVPALAIALVAGVLGYQRWAQSNSIRIARQWLDAGRLDRAAVAVQNALAAKPDLPASWRLASELAWRRGNRPASVEYAKKAAVVSRYQADDVLAWAEASILADDSAQARVALGFLDPETARTSPRALRLAGEIARREHRFADARDRFGEALRADKLAGTPSLAADEIPLGIVSLQTGVAADCARGRSLLAGWASDPRWGIDALRALVADAIARGEASDATRWAEALRLHPRCTLGDIPVCLEALSKYAPDRYRAVLGPLEDSSRSSPTGAAQLIGWLTQIGQGDEAVRWSLTLDRAAAGKPPIAPGIAEALRATRRWADLQAWIDKGGWGLDLRFLRLAYGFVAARQLGDEAKAQSAWQGLYADARSSAAHALFAGDSLYAWGYPKEATDLLWAAADRPDLAYQALGSLARAYQLKRDASGQCRVFDRLNVLRPADREIANNYAYFAALTGEGSQIRVERIAADNFAHDPSNVTYRSTYAFVLVWLGQAQKALTLMEPVSREWKSSAAVAFAYGSALAGLGRQSEAKEVFDSLDPRKLSPRELEWIRDSLR